ncbi:MAG: signal peptidase II [Ignavibacteriae bacterium]|nr:MAG: signal peptidase II [Ignavibacteriota bacterium]
MRVLYISFVVVVLDQISKLWVKGFNIPFLNLSHKGMDYGQSINVWGDLIKFTFVENPGMAFGIDVSGYSKLFLSLFSFIVSIGIVFYIYKSREQKLLFRIALALILGGAIGNLIDRFFYGIFYDYAPLLYGRVVDFLHFNALGFTVFGKTFDSFPIFNIADSSVTIGVFILLIFHKSFEEKKNEKDIIESSEDTNGNSYLKREANDNKVEGTKDSNNEVKMKDGDNIREDNKDNYK